MDNFEEVIKQYMKPVDTIKETPMLSNGKPLLKMEYIRRPKRISLSLTQARDQQHNPRVGRMTLAIRDKTEYEV